MSSLLGGVLTSAFRRRCFTDGLVERRGEDIDDGLARLARTAATPTGSVEGLLDTVLAQHTSSESEDDIALLAFRWLG